MDDAAAAAQLGDMRNSVIDYVNLTNLVIIIKPQYRGVNLYRIIYHLQCW